MSFSFRFLDEIHTPMIWFQKFGYSDTMYYDFGQSDCGDY